MRRNVVGLVAVVVLVGNVATACSRKQAPAAPEPVQRQTTVPAPQTTPTATPVVARDNDAERMEELRRLAAVLEQVVHFDYDEATIRTDAQELLAAKVPVLRANPSVRIRIEGHADERGSVEYNLALGMRRANAVRDYLADFGIDPSRFDTVSFGEDRPMRTGSSEAAWSQNRRAEFRVTVGLNM